MLPEVFLQTPALQWMGFFAMQARMVVTGTIATCSGISVSRCPSDVVSKQVSIESLTINSGQPPILFKTTNTSGCKLDFTKKKSL